MAYVKRRDLTIAHIDTALSRLNGFTDVTSAKKAEDPSMDNCVKIIKTDDDEVVCFPTLAAARDYLVQAFQLRRDA